MIPDPDLLLAGPRGRGLLVHLFDDVAIRILTMRADAPAGHSGGKMAAATSAVVEWRRYQNLGCRMQMNPMEEEA